MKTLIVSLTLFANLTGPVLAGRCVRRRVVTRRHVRVAVVEPLFVAQPIFQVGSALREEAIAQRAAELALAAFAQQLQAQILSGGGRGAVVDSSLDAPAGGGAGQTAVELQQVQRVLTSSCVRCHAGANPRGGLSLTDAASLTEAQRCKIAIFAHRGVMPPTGEPLPDDQAELLMRWAAGK